MGTYCIYYIDENGTVTPIQTLPGGVQLDPNAINEARSAKAQERQAKAAEEQNNLYEKEIKTNKRIGIATLVVSSLALIPNVPALFNTLKGFCDFLISLFQ